MKNPIVHFEIPADDIKRAKKFYEKIFGWHIEKYAMPGGPDYFIVRTTDVDAKRMPKTPGAINGGMMQRMDPGQVFTNYIHVASIDAMAKAIKANGGAMLMQKQEIGKGMGSIALFRDTERNIMGLHEMPKKKAK